MLNLKCTFTSPHNANEEYQWHILFPLIGECISGSVRIFAADLNEGFELQDLTQSPEQVVRTFAITFMSELGGSVTSYFAFRNEHNIAWDEAIVMQPTDNTDDLRHHVLQYPLN